MPESADSGHPSEIEEAVRDERAAEPPSADPIPRTYALPVSRAARAAPPGRSPPTLEVQPQSTAIGAEASRLPGPARDIPPARREPGNLLAPATPPIRTAVQLARAAQPVRQIAATPSPVGEPPAVHITIGRVEVRATAAPERPAMKPRPVAPGLKLDDYLRERDRGSR